MQWEILERAFGDPPTRLVLVGDPKQAIYAFRGADVHAYLAARRRAGDAQVRRLDRSWRADAGVLQGLDALFGDSALGHEEIRYARTTAAPGREATRLSGLAKPAPVRLRLVGSDRPGLTLTSGTGVVQKDSAIAFVAEDLAVRRGRAAVPGGDLRRPRRGAATARVRRRRRARRPQPGRPHGPRRPGARPACRRWSTATGSVFGTGAARAWLAVLEAVERPGRHRHGAQRRPHPAPRLDGRRGRRRG